MQQTVNASFSCKWKRQLWLFLLLNSTQYARQKNGGTQYVRKAKIGQYAVRKGEGGVTLITNTQLCNFTEQFSDSRVASFLYIKAGYSKPRY